MANNLKKISDRSACTAPVATDKLILSGNNDANSFHLPLGAIPQLVFSPVSNSVPAPANSSANGTPGEPARYDANFVYLCIAPNTWRRTALSTF